MVVVHNRANCIGVSVTFTSPEVLPSSVTTSEESANRPVTGGRQAFKTWQMTRWQEPGFYRHEPTLLRTRSAFWVKVRVAGLLHSPLHVFQMPLLRSLCRAGVCHLLRRSCLTPSMN